MIVLAVLLGMLPLVGTATPDLAFECPVTTPIEERPETSIDPFAKDADLHHENGLWVTIPGDGVMELSAHDALTFGVLAGWRSETVTWLRDEGIEGFVEVTGQRLDQDSELTPQTPLSPQRQYVRVGQVQTGLAFPSEGCWEVTGIVGKNEITWVVMVRFIDGAIATPGA